AGAQPGAMLQVMLQAQHTRRNMRGLTLGQNRSHVRPRADPSESVRQSEEASVQPSTLADVIPDKYRMRVMAIGGKDYVASAKLGDMDVLHGEFAITGSTAGELRIVLRGDSSTLSGQVSFHGQPAPGAMIYLIPANGDPLGIKTGFAAMEGEYKVVGIPP